MVKGDRIKLCILVKNQEAGHKSLTITCSSILFELYSVNYSCMIVFLPIHNEKQNIFLLCSGGVTVLLRVSDHQDNYQTIQDNNKCNQLGRDTG